jgi:hypothetical protein
MMTCAWCGQTFPPNTFGRPRVYCGPQCRRAHGRYIAGLPGWQAELARHETAAASYGRIPRQVPTFLRDEIAVLRDLIARR